MKSLNEFVLAELQRVARFESWWKEQHAVNPEFFPLDMEDGNEGQLEEQLAAFEDQPHAELKLEEEDAPIVVNQPTPGELAVGDYVFASRWSDCDPGDPWAVGHISEIGPNFVVVGDFSQRRWPKAMRISQQQGQRIIEKYPLMEVNYQPQNYKAIASVFGK